MKATKVFGDTYRASGRKMRFLKLQRVEGPQKLRRDPTTHGHYSGIFSGTRSTAMRGDEKEWEKNWWHIYFGRPDRND